MKKLFIYLFLFMNYFAYADEPQLKIKYFINSSNKEVIFGDDNNTQTISAWDNKIIQNILATNNFYVKIDDKIIFKIINTHKYLYNKLILITSDAYNKPIYCYGVDRNNIGNVNIYFFQYSMNPRDYTSVGMNMDVYSKYHPNISTVSLDPSVIQTNPISKQCIELLSK